MRRRNEEERDEEERQSEIDYKKGDDKEEKVGKRGRGMTMRKVWKRGRRSRRGGREEEEGKKSGGKG